MAESIINFFHLLGAAVWIGGAIFIHIVLNPSLHIIDPQQGGKLMSSIGKRFSIAAWSSYIVLIITGILKTPADMYLDFESDLGLYLSIKHLMVAAVLIIGIIIAVFIVPRMNAVFTNTGKPSEEFIRLNKRLHNFALVNTILGLAILLVSSLLW